MSASVVAVLVLNVLPVLAGTLSRVLHFSPMQVAAFGSANLFGLALGNLLSALMLGSRSVRFVSASGLTLLMLANLGVVLVPTSVALIGLSAVGGFGGGIATGACSYVFGQANQERNMSLYIVGQTVSTFALTIILPWMNLHFGWSSLFAFLAFITLLPILLTGYLSAAPPVAPVPDVDGRSVHISPRVWMGIAGTTLFFVGTGAMWTFLEPAGAASGISGAMLDRAMSVCAAVGFLSSVLALALGHNVTRRSVLVCCVLINVMGTATITSPNVVLFTISISAYYFSLPIIIACQFGAVTLADRTGLGAVYMSAATFVGYAMGPLIAGYLIERIGYSTLQYLNISLAVLAMITIYSLVTLLKANPAATPGSDLTCVSD